MINESLTVQFTMSSFSNVLYLHGFASSAASTKARFFADRLAEAGITLHCPDFNEPAFETLTVTRMLDQVDALISSLAPGPLAVIGSSLGAFVAVHAAARNGRGGPGRPYVDRLVLLAPALDFSRTRLHLEAETVRQWETTDRLDVFHYGMNRLEPLRFAFYRDAARYDAFAVALAIPVLIFQGTRDAAVDPRVPQEYADTRPNVTVRFLDDDHQLLGSLETIWAELTRFLVQP
jgi:pimeloyl-ACP methyl ester carboxylesterase